MRILVCGAGGFIGGHLVRQLLDEGHRVRAVDIKPLEDWWQIHEMASNWNFTIYEAEFIVNIVVWIKKQVVNLAADMGGIGFIEDNKAACMLSVLINTHLLMAARDAGVKRYFYSSSACVYNADKQDKLDGYPLNESDAYPAMAEDGYGWEKLFSERMCRHFREDFGLETRVARFHNVYGPHGSWNDGREKAPAAICRKVVEAKLSGKHKIDVWGDGNQIRSFMWIDDCIDGIRRIMDSDITQPINLGSAESVTINQLIDIVQGIAGISLSRTFDLSKPQGVRGRSSDNTLIKARLGWEPQTPLQEGLKKTFEWIELELLKHENAEYRK